jgi:hypothetical protein
MVMKATDKSEQDSSDLNETFNPQGGEHPIVAHRLVRVLDWLQLHRGSDYDRRKLFVERVAAIIGKTYVEGGDAAELADDVALMLIRDLLLELDGRIISQNRRIRNVCTHPLVAKRKYAKRKEIR